MKPLPSINKIYSMVIQEESNNIDLLPKLDNNLQTEESNTLINAYNARKSQDRGKNHMHPGLKKRTSKFSLIVIDFVILLRHDI